MSQNNLGSLRVNVNIAYLRQEKNAVRASWKSRRRARSLEGTLLSTPTYWGSEILTRV